MQLHCRCYACSYSRVSVCLTVVAFANVVYKLVCMYVRMYIHVCICWPSFIVGHKDAVRSLLLVFLEALLLYVVHQLFILLTCVLHT